MIAAVVVTHRAPAGMLDACVIALRTHGGVDHVVVVDNGDEPCALAPADDLTVVRADNAGYGAAANVGFAHASALGADPIVLLNDDVAVTAGWLTPLVEAFEGDRIGAAQPMLVAAGGREIASLGVHVGRDGAGVDIGRGDRVAGLGGDPYEIELFTGGAVAFAADFLADTGGFDERWFLYYEDVDLARRGAARGWRFLVVPQSCVEHRGGVTTASDARATRYLQERNRLWSAFRHEPPRTIAAAVWLSLRRLRHRPYAVHARALAAGVAGAPSSLWRRARGRCP